jgi:uncharacterized protein (TIGR01777 family)
MGRDGSADRSDRLTTEILDGRPTRARGVVAISGASGLIGSALAREFILRGTEVRPLVRHAPRAPNEIAWDIDAGTIDAAKLEGVGAVIHLAGENLAQRWSSEIKRKIRESRVKSTMLLARTLASLTTKPAALLSGSAIGVYGSRGDEVLDESSPLGSDFLAEVCKAWEASSAPAADAGIRVVSLRTGLVLSKDSGLLPKLLLPFRAGIGGKLGDGNQWMSWIGLADYVRAVVHLIDNDSAVGPANLVSANPVTNEEFTSVLARVLKRPSLFTVPAFAMKLAMGEMAEATALASQRVRPRRLLDLGFEFNQPTLESALRSVLA